MAQYLRERGYDAFALKGGYQAWKSAGYPVEPKEVEMSTTIDDVCPECGRAMADHAS